MFCPCSFSTFLNALLTVFFPKFCTYCSLFTHQLRSSTLCFSCYEQIKPIAPITIPLTRTKQITIIAASAYQEPIKSLILAKSYSDYGASKKLGKLIVDCTPITQLSFDYIIPIPLHWKRYASRGYNQADSMASIIALHLQIPVIQLLTRTRNNPFQSSLPIEQRSNNVAAIFHLKSKDTKWYHKNFLLVDDLVTTQATIKSAAKTLLPLKPRSITVVTAARANIRST
ncbi:MAG: hypothetical protein WBQ73_04045 [Candidatus Babeliales bacterium]